MFAKATLSTRPAEKCHQFSARSNRSESTRSRPCRQATAHALSAGSVLDSPFSKASGGFVHGFDESDDGRGRGRFSDPCFAHARNDRLDGGSSLLVCKVAYAPAGLAAFSPASRLPCRFPGGSSRLLTANTQHFSWRQALRSLGC